MRWPVERVEIPYEGASMPGWLFHPDTSRAARPVLVMNNGSDGSISGCWCEGAEGGLERGYRVLLFDGPGQQSMLFERDIPFRHDWEQVLTPVVDLLVAREDVDAARIAVYGVSQAGLGAARAGVRAPLRGRDRRRWCGGRVPVVDGSTPSQPT